MTRPIYMRLPHGETDSRKQYSMPDPVAVCDVARRVHEALYHHRSEPDPGDMGLLLSVAQSYLHLTTYELGQEHCVKQLRDIWRAMRAREKEQEAQR